jgi:hypothetical protein
MIFYKSTRKFKEGGILSGVKKIPAEMKEIIQPYITSSSKYMPKSGNVMGLQKPSGMPKEASGLGFGANKDGFFVYTHRARCKSVKDPLKIPMKSIKFIQSTG